MGIRDVFKKGIMEMLVLVLLSESDLYGNQFPQLISKYSNGVIVIPEGSLYPLLYRLVDEGYVSCTRVPSGKRRILVYYHLGPSGAERLHAMVSEYRIFADSVQSFLSSCNFSVEEGRDHD